MLLTRKQLCADFWFHGTNKEYHDEQLEKHGRYQHTPYHKDNECSVNITTSKKLADGYAFDRSVMGRRLGRTPVTLKICAKKIRDRISRDRVTRIPSLDFILPDEYELIFDLEPEAIEIAKRANGMSNTVWK